jgi:putative Holliday junction resolvase
MKILAIDIGLKRIGIAYSPDNNFVFPSEPVFRKNRDQASRDIFTILEEKKIELLVVGLPKGGSSEEEMERRIKHFVNLINFKKEIVYQDEYGTSTEAKEISKGIVKQKKDGKIDSISAKLILERYLKLA